MEFQSEKNVLGVIKTVVKTVVTTFLITTILMAVLALVICYTPMPEETVTGGVYILNYLSTFMAGLFSASKCGRKGFVTGGISGGLYMLLVYGLGVVLFGGITFTKDIMMSILYCILTGMAGGIVGINVSRK